jgi:hypothetical protein
MAEEKKDVQKNYFLLEVTDEKITWNFSGHPAAICTHIVQQMSKVPVLRVIFMMAAAGAIHLEEPWRYEGAVLRESEDIVKNKKN